MPYISSPNDPAPDLMTTPGPRPKSKGCGPVIDNAQVTNQRYILYTFRYSLRSLMVRYAYAIAMANRKQQTATVTKANGHHSLPYSAKASELVNGSSSTASEIRREMVLSINDASSLLKNGSLVPAVRNDNGAGNTNGLLPVRQPMMNASTPEAVLGAEKTEQELAMNTEIREVNLQRGENCEEWFLGGVNPKGQVPVLLTSSSNPPSESLTSTLFITLRLARLFPDSLLPPQHTASIVNLLSRLHNICFESLSFRPEEFSEHGGLMKNGAVELLLSDKGREKLGVGVGEQGERWREMLEWKREFHASTLLHALSPSSVSSAIAQTHAFFADYMRVRRQHHQQNSPLLSSGPENSPQELKDTESETLRQSKTKTCDNEGISWTFGKSVGPTALDAHVIAFVARLRDADERARSLGLGLEGRYETLVPPELRKWVERVCDGEGDGGLWRGVMPAVDGGRGGKTM
ncbi:MAG: hypothetical protein Q9160_008957 [Pyrenula sp. 1 TL-2023]